MIKSMGAYRWTANVICWASAGQEHCVVISVRQSCPLTQNWKPRSPQAVQLRKCGPALSVVIPLPRRESRYIVPGSAPRPPVENVSGSICEKYEAGG